MSFQDADNLVPAPSSFQLNGKTYVLRPFSMNAYVWAGKKFAKGDIEEGLNNMARILSRELGEWEDFRKTLVTLGYYLLDHDSKKQISERKLDKKINQKTYLSILNAISECMGNSQKQYDEAETRVENKELKKKIELLEKRLKTATG